jgi:hypothetical protein
MKISGKIVDINDEPLSSANIVLITGSKANKVGTISNFDGEFQLERDDIDENSIFKISFIGFVSQTFKAEELQDKKITLLESVDMLNEVVLVGSKPKPKEDVKPILVKHFEKNRYVYAGIAGGLGILIIGLSIKKL